MSKLGKHLSNIFDPTQPDAQMYLTYSHQVIFSGPAAMEREWQHHLDWVAKNVIGPPKATSYYSQQQLEKMGMVGIYKKQEAKSK